MRIVVKVGTSTPVSYTHLDVYKRQLISRVSKIQTTLAMVLAGVMISSLFTSGTSFIKLVADPTDQDVYKRQTS